MFSQFCPFHHGFSEEKLLFFFFIKKVAETFKSNQIFHFNMEDFFVYLFTYLKSLIPSSFHHI